MKLCMICHFEDLKCKIQIFLTVYFCTNTVKVNLFLHTGQVIDVVVERTEPAVGNCNCRLEYSGSEWPGT